MKLTDLKSLQGTYAAVRVLEPSNALISEFIKSHNIPAATNPKEKRKHVTLLYSRNFLPDYQPNPTLSHLAKVTHYDKFTFRSGDKEQSCLVMVLSAPTLEARHCALMSEHPATYDYPIYHPHITVSYDVGKDFDIGVLPMFSAEIQLGLEYMETLDLNYGK